MIQTNSKSQLKPGASAHPLSPDELHKIDAYWRAAIGDRRRLRLQINGAGWLVPMISHRGDLKEVKEV